MSYFSTLAWSPPLLSDSLHPSWKPLGFQLHCLLMNDVFYLPVPLNVVACASFPELESPRVFYLQNLVTGLSDDTEWCDTCASAVAISVGYGWPFMQCLSENGSSVFESDYIDIILHFKNIAGVLHKS